MSTPWLVDVSQPRTAPEDIRRRLRALDPTAEVICVSGRRWIVGRVRPTRDAMRIATHMLATYWTMTEKARASVRGVQRYRFALAALQGFRPVAQYDLRDLDDRVVNDFAESQWRMRHTRGDLLEAWDREEEAEKAARRAELGSLDRAKNVVNYVKQSNFGAATPSVQSSRPDVIPSSRTRHVTLT